MYSETICNREPHLDCRHCQSANKPIAKILNYGEGKKISRLLPEGHLVFLISGELEFSYASMPTIKAAENDIFAVPRKIGVTLLFLRPTTLLVFRLQLGVNLCIGLRKRIFGFNSRPTGRQGSVLHCNSLLQQQMQTVSAVIEKQFLCKKFLCSQIESISTTICAFYPTESLVHFFAPLFVHSPREAADALFKSTMLQAQRKVFSVSDLASLVNLNVNSFRQKFERIFNMKPFEWITENRKTIMLEEFSMNTKTLDEIAEKLCFSRPNEIHRFCHKHFGLPAKEIRKGKIMRH
jgi:AraC-like DNA-binding protein